MPAKKQDIEKLLKERNSIHRPFKREPELTESLNSMIIHCEDISLRKQKTLAHIIHMICTKLSKGQDYDLVTFVPLLDGTKE